MTHVAMTCLYAELHSGQKHEDEPTKEHVLAEGLGGRATLPDGAVCAACNFRLNKEVDEPFKAIFQSALNLFGMGSNKRGQRLNRVPIVAEINGMEMAATFAANGEVAVKPDALPSQTEPDGRVKLEFRARSKEQALAWLDARKKEGLDVESVGIEEIEGKGIRIKDLGVEGNAVTAYRATAKTALNLLALRAPAIARSPVLSILRRFALFGEGKELIEFASNMLPPEAEKRPEFDATRLRPQHLVAVGSGGGKCVTTLSMFSTLNFRLTLSAPGLEEFHFEHCFGGDGKMVVADYWGSHPDHFLVEAGTSADSRVRHTDGLPDAPGVKYVHQRLVGANWVRCADCSQGTSPPHKTDAEFCHEVSV